VEPLLSDKPICDRENQSLYEEAVRLVGERYGHVSAPYFVNGARFCDVRGRPTDDYGDVCALHNGETILTSERYTTKQNANGGIQAVKVNAPLDSRYDRRTSGSQYYFVLRGGNNEVLGTSERYTSKQAMENGISAVKKKAPNAPTRDQT
jgi:uncharacterized protein